MKFLQGLTPRSVELLRQGYSWKTFTQDLSAGVIVGVVAIPLAVAFAMASGVTPDKGLITAVIAGFLISALGGSQVQIGGPTGAFIVIVYGIVTNPKYGVEGLILATLMAGIILAALGLARLGSVIQFIPFPVVLGFTAGIAVIIFSSQINDFLGLGLRDIPGDFIEKWDLYLMHLDKVNFWALGLGLGTIGLILLLMKIHRRIPGALVALVVGTLLVYFLGWPVETIGSRFGAISGSIPLPSFPAISFDRIRELLLPAFSIAMLAGIESLLSAVVADGMTGKKHNSNMELVAQGIANVASSLFGGIPATGAIARTATNVKSGGKTPVAGMIHALVLLGVLVFLAPLAAAIPLAVLAGILITVAYNMSEHHTVRLLLKAPPGDLLSLVVTFLLTVLVDLTVAIPLGILLALLAFIRKMSESSQIKVHHREVRDSHESQDPFGLTNLAIPEGVEVFELDGPFFFGAAQRFKEQMALLENPPQVRILRMKGVSSVDASGLMVLRDLVKEAHAKGTRLILASVQPGVRKTLDRIGLSDQIGLPNLVETLMEALERARLLLGHQDLTLAQKFEQGVVAGPLDARDSLQVIQKILDVLPCTHTMKHRLRESLIQREEMASTAFGGGLAFPHPRSPVLEDPSSESVNLFYFPEGVDYGAPDGQKVTCAILILSASVQSHLKTLSQIARWTRKPEVAQVLARQGTKEELLALLKD